MCGITGIINNTKKKVLYDEIKNMNDLISHRGPNDEGFYFGDNFAFGHRRLSIVDLSPLGHQPMEYLNRYVITYNGEVYNHIELRKELEAKGYKFKSHTDTEVIMASYDCWGVECLNKFNGMWAFMIYDKDKEKYFISRDRFGKKPFYYYKSDSVFIFASEMKSILKYSEFETKPNIEFLDNYVKNGCKEYVKETAFENIYRFDFASYFEGNINELFSEFKCKKFWTITPNLSIEKFDKQKLENYANKYYELLEDAVKIRLRADVKVGSALSGGLDSSSIVYFVNKLLKEQGKEELQETFSSVYKSDGTQHCDESVYINIMAKKLGVQSNQIEPNVKDIPMEHKKMIWNMENPPDSTCMSGWHTFKLVASTDVKVTLDGQGADEQLAGYLSYLMTYLSSLSLIDLITQVWKYTYIPNSKKFIFAGFSIGVFRNILGDKLTKYMINKVLRRNSAINLNEQLCSDIERNLITLIHYSDHASMAFSIESRMPFMDYRLVEFLASVPACYKMHNGWTKYLARVAFDGKLPDEIVWRKDKMGWPIPEEYWFRGDLKEWFLEEIKSSKLVDRYNIDIEKDLEADKRIIYLIRYLNISRFEKLFLGEKSEYTKKN